MKFMCFLKTNYIDQQKSKKIIIYLCGCKTLQKLSFW